ncbi:carboxypeptidase-like regulatory domain-containing protein [Chryseobacterium indoltheticum]|uniref:carboxypeptidase-like regulatory domain-containing protein n=1 Tax=Chryseobacterium indoltheticum TaxID=254 RepID=UPI003F49509E
MVSDDNQALPGATVTIEGTKKVIITDSEGRFTISDLKEGQYNLKVSYIGFESKNLNIEIVDAQNLDVGSIVLYQRQKNIDEVIISGTLKNSE